MDGTHIPDLTTLQMLFKLFIPLVGYPFNKRITEFQ